MENRLKEEKLLEKLKKAFENFKSQLMNREKKMAEYELMWQAYTQLKEIVEEHFGLKNWTCTFEEYYALPEPIRNYIAALETNADPPSMVRENIFYKETIAALDRKNELLMQTIKAQQKPAVTAEEVFHFHQNLMTISDDSKTAEECHAREIDYIHYWLRENSMEVVEVTDERE